MQLETLFLVANRAQTAEALVNIPHGEQPTEADLKDYGTGEHPFVPSPAWGKYFPQLCAWINDYEYKKRRNANRPDAPGFEDNSFNLSNGGWDDE